MSEQRFPPEVIKQLGYYVYRLTDPRNGETFYLGKGKGNRLFEHVRGALSITDPQDEDAEDAKLSRIVAYRGRALKSATSSTGTAWMRRRPCKLRPH